MDISAVTRIVRSVLGSLAAMTLLPLQPADAETAASFSQSDGQHDFDWEIGTWKTDLRRLKHPLSGSNVWVSYSGTSTVRKVWGGRANLVELEVDGPTGPFRGASLRLYDPEARQWSLNYANAADGIMTKTPAIGSFKNGVGEFYDQEEFGGRAVLVRFVISKITRTSAHFEQAFSADGGRTWEVNWIADDTQIPPRK